MGVRELIIMLLGLAIVGVVLRGLYVAIQTRRGQIRLAIDKNIPQDIDLEDLELAELPSGGARVVGRSDDEAAEMTASISAANARAADMDLDDGHNEAIPVLMDAVEINTDLADKADAQSREAVTAAVTDGSAAEPPQELATDRQRQEMQDEYRQAHQEVQHEEGPDAVLFDYDTDDGSRDDSGLSAVTPDYPEQPEVSGELTITGYPAFDAESADPDRDVPMSATGEFAEAQSAVAETAAAEPAVVDDESEAEPASAADADLSQFSMTAGERIGFEGERPRARQASLFDEEAPVPETEVPERSRGKPGGKPRDTAKDSSTNKPRRKTLFAAFGRSRNESPEPAPQAAAVNEDFEAPVRDTVEPVMESRNAIAEPSEVVVLNIMAPEGHQFIGDELMEVLITSGLKFGEMNIFHHRLGRDSKGPVLFSVANILNPGTFDLNTMHEFTTPGISLFLPLPAPMNNLEGFEQLLQIARRICQGLGGELRDDQRNIMTGQTIEHYRQRICDFELRQLKAAGARA